MKITKNYIFFWGSIFSNWYTTVFNMGDHVFENSEQAFMYEKAMLFRDFEVAERILRTPNPKDVKKLGRAVKDFQENVWIANRELIMFNCLFAKFTSSVELIDIILTTGENKSFVEASPFDKIWGIGMKESEPGIENPENWKGLNLLGKTLDKVREVISRNKQSIIDGLGNG